MKFRYKDMLQRLSAPLFRLVPAVMLTLVLLTVPPGWSQQSPAALQADAATRADYHGIATRLLCQCGTCGYLVDSCNHLDCSSATYIRKAIRSGLAEGKGEEVIVASFVEQYGPKVLSEPPLEGFSWMAWIMPFFGLIFGGCCVGIVLFKWKAVRRGTESGGKSSGAIHAGASGKASLTEKYRAKIDQELEKF
jgi:cytochrome c-type biogenesis protein CcmH